MFAHQVCNRALSVRSGSRFAATPVRVREVSKGVAVRATPRTVVAAAMPETSTVKILVQGRNLSVTEPIKEYAESKVQKVFRVTLS